MHPTFDHVRAIEWRGTFFHRSSGNTALSTLLLSVMLRSAATFFVLVLVLSPAMAFAADVSVTPAVVDLKGKPRDILKQTLHLINTSSHVVELYPRVDDTDTYSGEQSFQRAHGSDALAESFANWIELSRGVITISPGEEKDVPFVLRVHQDAATGLYHARIAFSSGATRADAESKDPVASVTINLEVEEDAKEILQINTFASDSNIVFTGDDVLFKYQLQNVGNRDELPTGEIRIYDRRGHEVASVDVNREGKTLVPDQSSQIASVWSAVEGFGKFKATINVRYGRNQTASVQDVAYFWIIPWKQLLMVLGVVMVAALILAFYFHRWLEERHFVKLAAAGLVKAEALVHFPHLQRPHSVSSVPAVQTPADVEAPAGPKEGRRYFKYVLLPFTFLFSVLRALVSLVRHKKRSDKVLLDEIEASAHTSAPAVSQPSLGAPPPTPAPSHGGTINLKNMGAAPQDEWHVASPSATQHGSVINLKK